MLILANQDDIYMEEEGRWRCTLFILSSVLTSSHSCCSHHPGGLFGFTQPIILPSIGKQGHRRTAVQDTANILPSNMQHLPFAISRTCNAFQTYEEAISIHIHWEGGGEEGTKCFSITFCSKKCSSWTRCTSKAMFDRQHSIRNELFSVQNWSRTE